jgi:hypothetical protein
LELAFLDADEVVSAPAPVTSDDGHQSLTVLVVAAEADLRRYVRECLRERPDVRVVEAATIAMAVDRAAADSLHLLIVDEPESGVLALLSELRAIVLVDDVPHGAPAPAAGRRLLSRPFSAERLVTELGEVLRSGR